jgi:hypothetical protein
VANFASAYQQHGVEAHLHAVRQELGETLRKFISRFTKVRGMIPRISDASIITAFRQGVRDEKLLEKLATHDVETVPTLFALADKYARAAEGHAWHSAPKTGAAQSSCSGAILQDGKKKKDRDYQKSRSTALVVAAATEGQVDRKSATNARGRRRVAVVHALCTRTVATAPRSVTRSLTSQNASASGASSLPKTAPRLAAGPTRKRWMTARWSRLSGTSGISRPRGT